MRTRALLALVLFVAACQQREENDVRAREGALKNGLFAMRKAIDRFYRDHKRYPHKLEELVPNYLREIPVDPLTGSNKTWQLVTEEAVQPSSDFATGATTTAATPNAPQIIDVRSGAGAPYSNY